MKEEKTFIGAAFLIALAMVVGAYLLSTVDYAPKLNVSDITSTPNVYVSSNPPEHVLTVSGVATERVNPDLLNIQVRIETQDENAKQSQEDNAEVSAQVMQKLKDLGLTEDEIKTVSYRVDVVRESEKVCDTFGCEYKYKIVGYKTTHSLNLRVTDLDNGGEIIDGVSSFGENEVFIDYVSFTLQEETRMDIQKELLKEAGQEAREKAQAIAEGVGGSLGKVVQASESVYYPTRSYYEPAYDYAMAESAAPVPTSLSSGEIEVSATVSVGYEFN